MGPESTREFLVECTECDKRLETDNAEAAALFEREHQSYSGHEVNWSRGERTATDK